MDNLPIDIYASIILNFLGERYGQTRKQLNELENELRTMNRYFPNTTIIKKIDTLIEAPHRLLTGGEIVYRCRTIDKFHEQDFLMEYSSDLANGVRNQIPNLDEMKGIFEFLKLGEYQHKQNLEQLLSDSDMKYLTDKYSAKGWWGYDEKNSDAPPIGTASAGRINPAGISYLYAADNEKTAALEVRPVISQYVSIAEIEIKENVKLFDFTANFEDEEAQKHSNESVDWSTLGEYFSQPNYSGDSAYLATQYISEYIKNLKDDAGVNIFDGLCFRSSLDSDGLNYVLFDTSENRKYKINCSSIFQVKDLLGTLERQLPLPVENGLH